MDTLVFDYGLVAINRPGDLHPLDLCHARHTELPRTHVRGFLGAYSQF